MTPSAQDDDAAKFEDELKPGTQLLHGQYVIEEFLNNGGFGITYLAKDSLHRRVVIKECFPEAICRRSNATVGVRSRNQVEAFRTLVELFIEEARKLARLSHPNIVGVHQVFEDNDTAYMAMDFVEGRDLLEIVESGEAIEPEKLQRIVVKLLDAIEFIHKQGILHRDIAPDNILLDKHFQPVLIDFGAARETVTRATRFLGSMRTVKDGYSPQEFYVTGSDQFPSSDLYSLAASLYHVLTGQVPISAQERLSAIASGEGDSYVSVRERVSGYPEPFLEAIDKALEVFPKNRIETAADWRALITQSSVSHATRGSVSQPILAVDNGNILEQFEDRKPTSVIGGLRRSESKADAHDAASLVAASAHTPQPKSKALKSMIDEPAKSSGKGLYVGVAAAALVAVVGVGAIMMGGGADPNGTPSVDVASPVEPSPTPAPSVFSEPSSTPLPWEVAAARARDAEPADEDSPQVVADAGPTTSDAATVAERVPPVEPTVLEASSVIVGKALEFPVFGDPSDPTLISQSSGAAADQLSPGLRVVSINGFPISSLDEFQRIAAATATFEVGDSIDVDFGIEDPSNGNTFVRTVALPAVQQTMLLNGVSFQTTQKGDAWETLVTSGTGSAQDDLQPGDRIIALMPENELIDTEDGVQQVILRQIADGETQFNFAVNRGGDMWLATMSYAGR